MDKINHDIKSIDDMFHLIGELELARKHAVYGYDQFEQDEIYFFVLASELKELRRQLMPDLDKRFHCILKHLCAARELSYEVFSDDRTASKTLDKMLENLWFKATGEKLELCSACAEDKVTKAKKIEVSYE